MIQPAAQELSNLSRALARHFAADEAQYLAVLLSIACRSDSLGYEEIPIEEYLKDDIILLAYEKRLLLPMKSIRGSAWEDRILSFSEGERYHLPRVVRLLAEKAAETGVWDTESTIPEVLSEAGEREIGATVRLLDSIITTAANGEAMVETMKALCADSGLDLDMHDTLDHFVRCGIMSPVTQRSLHSGSPRYEINPCLYWGGEYG